MAKPPPSALIGSEKGRFLSGSQNPNNISVTVLFLPLSLSQPAVKHTQFPTNCCFSFYLSTVINQRQVDRLSLCLQPVPHSLKAHQRPQSLSCPGKPCDNTVNNSNVWREGATGAATVRLSKWGQGLLVSGDVCTKCSPAQHYAPHTLPVSSLLSGQNLVHLFVFQPHSPALCYPMLTVWGEEKGKKKNLNWARRDWAGPSLPTCLRENTGVILEITLLKINVGLEECVIVP